MAHRVLAETAVSISEHKKNPMATVAAGEGMAVAVLNRNEPAFYCVPARAHAPWPTPSPLNRIDRAQGTSDAYVAAVDDPRRLDASPRA